MTDPKNGVSDKPIGVTEIFWRFLLLGCTSFGGPVAHLGYFRDEFVKRRRWISDQAYADLIAFCQFLPGPASSQVGMAIGLSKGGYGGMFAAWVAFTLPSALIMFGFAYGVNQYSDLLGGGWILGLKAATVAIVAQALLGMASSLTPDRRTASIALVALLVVFLIPGAVGQVTAILIGGFLGTFWCRHAPQTQQDNHKLGGNTRAGTAAFLLILFATLMVVLPVVATFTPAQGLTLLDSFYRAGALVFGGGHVVLPLLQAEMVQTGLVSREDFLAGYGLAQAVPGPLFTFSSYLGAIAAGPLPATAKAGIATLGIFLPSFFLITGGLPLWNRMRRMSRARKAMTGVNAAVVGLLAAALYDPVFAEGITGTATLAIAAVSFIALKHWNIPAWAIVIVAGLAGGALL